MEKTPDALRKTRESNPRIWRTGVFIARFMLIGIFFRSLAWFLPSTPFLQEAIAKTVETILGVLSIQAESTGSYLAIEETVYFISRDCTGWKSVSLFLGLVFASRDLDRHRLVILGIIAIFLANIVRIVSTLLLSHAGILPYEVIHGVLWKWSLTSIVVLAWIGVYRLKPENL